MVLLQNILTTKGTDQQMVQNVKEKQAEITANSSDAVEAHAQKITFAHAVSTLNQVNIQPQSAVPTLYANELTRDTDEYQKWTSALEYNRPLKRCTRLEDIKARTKCKACEKFGQWLKDNPKCIKRLQQKRTEKCRQDRHKKDDEQDTQKRGFGNGVSNEY